ncbi:MAG: hypothetical protein Q3979_05110 [Actinomycetaceae bacterium]|nr:hypothetical protein [Actinomycetaceae bacterium]
MLYCILVILDSQDGHTIKIKRVDLGGILAYSVMPEDQTLGLETLF